MNNAAGIEKWDSGFCYFEENLFYHRAFQQGLLILQETAKDERKEAKNSGCG
jgi:hypothetical protein